MKIIQVVPSIDPDSGGPSYSVPMLCESLALRGAEVELQVLAPAPEQKNNHFNMIVSPSARYPHPRLGRSPKMLQSLRKSCRQADIIQNNGLWMMPNIYSNTAREGSSCKLVMSPRGTLATWSLRRSPWKKRLFGWAGQYQALREADMFHATSEKEYEEIRSAGYRQPVMIVPIGMELPMLPEGKKRQIPRKLLFLGRFHEVKCLDRLLDAWGQIAVHFPDWELVLAGPDYGCRKALESQAASLPRVSFRNEVYGAEKYALLQCADLYILPSNTENFGITVAEALACGTPVIASRGTPWSGLISHNAGWWIDNDVQSLAKVLNQIMSNPFEQLTEMGKNGQRWVLQEFSWTGVATRTMQAYQWLLHGGDKPDFIFV